jgi:SAM-dependent methyltransferase
MSYASVTGHRTMALDRVRNDAYAAALGTVITPDSVVLDLGAGTGIHGLIAARLGARRVYLVDPEDIISVAEEVARANRLEEVVRCLHGRIEDVEIDEPVDVIVSALTGNFLLTEDLLPVLFHARDKFLKPGGAMVPSAALMEAVPVAAPAVHTREIAAWSDEQHGVQMEPARGYAANALHYRWDRQDVTFLADPATIHRVDLSTDSYQALHAEVEFEARTAGTCHGFAGWFDIRLGDRWISTSPRAEPMHWSPAFLPMDPPVALSLGDRLTFRLDRPPAGDWTWRASWNGGSQRHSTLLSTPLKATTLRKVAADYRPLRNAEGEAVNFVLAHSNGEETVTDIAHRLRQQWPDVYRTSEAALRFVQSVVKNLA